MASSSSESESSTRKHHKSKKSSGKKTKKRYRNKSDDDEKGYKKFKRKKEKKSKSKKRESRSDSEPRTIGPSAFPPTEPTPPAPDQRDSKQEEEEVEPESDNYGPALPPHLQKPRNIGPQLPTNFQEIVNNSSTSYQQSNSSDEDDDMVGPLLGVSNPDLETRALEMKLGKYGESNTNTSNRETWMTELPSIKTVSDLGITGKKQFKARAGPDFSDRSDWTDTPGDKERKKNQPKAETSSKEDEIAKIVAKKRDAEQEKIAKELKKNRKKTLMELHEEKLNEAKKAKKEEPQTRRPFDRNIDLAANRFDEAQKKNIVKKAQLLDNRFSSGASKYL